MKNVPYCTSDFEQFTPMSVRLKMELKHEIHFASYIIKEQLRKASENVRFDNTKDTIKALFCPGSPDSTKV